MFNKIKLIYTNWGLIMIQWNYFNNELNKVFQIQRE